MINGSAIHGENEERGTPVKGDHGSFFLKAKKWFRDDAQSSADWRKEAEECYRFFAGDQWDEEAKQKLREQLRPCITFNRTIPIIKTVSGYERNNRQEIRYIPRTLGDAQVNEVFTSASQWARDVTYAEDKESDAFLDLLITGMGWTEERIDFEEDPEGRPGKDHLDPLEMYWDGDAKERNLRDARRKWRVRDIPLEDARDMFGDDHDIEDLNALWARNWRPQSEPHDADRARFYEVDQSGRDHDTEPEMVTIVHLQWWEKRAFVRIADPTTGESADLEPDEFEKLNKRFQKFGLGRIPAVRLKRRRYYQAFIGGKVLEKTELLSKRHFTFQAMTGERDHMGKCWFGIVRQVKDPQAWTNKFFSQILHIVNTTAIPGIMAEQNTFVDVRQAEKDLANPARIVEMNPGGAAKIVPKVQNQAPPQLFQLMEFAVTNIRDTVGINLELMGMRDVNQPGVLEYQRKQAAMTVLATLFDNLRSYRKIVGEIQLEFIQEYFTDGRLIRIVGDEGEKYVPLTKIPGVVDFDVIVDEAPSAPNQKEAAWMVIERMLPMIAEQMTPDLWASVLDYTPLPASLVEKIKKAITEAAKNPQPDPEAQKAQAEIQKIQMTTQATAQKSEMQTKAAAQKTQMQLQGDQMKAETAAMLADKELQIKEQELALRQQELVMESEFKAQAHMQRMEELQFKALNPPPQKPAPAAR